LIKVKNITKKYDAITAVDNVSFEIAKGEITGFLGPNGAGKSTLLRIMTGTLSPSSGSVEIGGVDMKEDPIKAKKLIGYLPENNPLYPDYTPRQYLTFISRIKEMQEPEQETERVMKAVSILDKADIRVTKLSKGYRQRVGLAAALIGTPAILLLDEPTVGLDPNQIVEIRELIRELGKTNTILLSTHILQEVNSVCNKVIIIHKGSVRAVDSHEGLLDRLEGQNRVHVTLQGDVENVIEKLNSIKGIMKTDIHSVVDGMTRIEIVVRRDTEARPEIAKAVISAKAELYEMEIETLSLEDVFMKLTNEQESAT